MSFPLKSWRQKDGKYICDGDCHAWNIGICTCGLLHHLNGNSLHELDWHTRKFRSRHWKAEDILRDANIKETTHCKHNIDIDLSCSDCDADFHKAMLANGWKISPTEFGENREEITDQ